MSDVLRTTLGIGGGGLLTRRIARTHWLMARRLEPENSHRVRSAAGPTILMITLVLWLAFLWSGWTLVFGSESAAVVHATSGRPAGLIDRIYFTGYTLFTLGIGDMVPRGGVWQLATAVASVNGFFVATLAIAYVIPTLGAAVEKRRLAAWISTLGETPESILTNAWDGQRFAGLEGTLSALIPAIELHTQRHHAYPVVHYFHGSERRSAIGPSIAALDEAVAILFHAVSKEARPATPLLLSTRAAIGGLIDTLGAGFLSPAVGPPPLPDLAALRRAGLPVDQAVSPEWTGDEQRRSLLLSFVRDYGWRWRDLTPPTRQSAHP